MCVLCAHSNLLKRELELDSAKTNNKDNLAKLSKKFGDLTRKLEEETSIALNEYERSKHADQVKHEEELLQARGLSGIKLVSDEHHAGEIILYCALFYCHMHCFVCMQNTQRMLSDILGSLPLRNSKYTCGVCGQM